jgi:hypothetical protein
MKAFAALILLCLVVSLLALASPIKAQEPINLTIKPDGSIEPATSLLERNGNTYIFKDDIYGNIWVQKDDIIMDGGGHTLQGFKEIREDLSLFGVTRPYCVNVLVKNLRVYDGLIITQGARNNSFVGNYFENSHLYMQFGGNNPGNLVKHNTFKNSSIFYDYNNYGIDVITENNFINSSLVMGLAVSPVADYNYWSDYMAKYPNAKELGNSGIWDTPYVGKNFGNGQCTDYHPLMNMITDFEVPSFTNPNLTPIPISTPTPTSSATLTPASSPPNFGQTSPPTPSPTQLPIINTGAEPPQTEPFLTAQAVFVAVIVIVVGMILLGYFSKRIQRKNAL